MGIAGPLPTGPPADDPGSPPEEVPTMRLRPLALFALTAGLTVLVGNFGTADAAAQPEKKGKKKKFDPPPAATPAPATNPEPAKPATPAKPLPTVVAAPTTK